MADNETTQHREGDILSTTVGEDGVVRVDRWENGEVRTHAYDSEPVHRASPAPELAPDGSPIPTLVFESHAAPDGSGRIIETFRDEDGDLRTRTIDHEPVAYAPPPQPTVVEITQVAELDAWVHQAAAESHAADTTPLPMAEIVDAPEATLIQSTTVDDRGVITTVYRDEDGDLRTRTIDHEPVAYPAPPIPTVIDFEVTTRAASHDADIDASPAYGSEDGNYAAHHDGAGADSAAHYGDQSSPAGHEADHTVTSTEEGS